MIFDAFPGQPQDSIEYCIVGAGPVGVSVALVLSRMGHRVHVLEAGGRNAAPDTTGEFGFELASPDVHARGDLVSRQGLGGTSTAWGACCVPFDPVDLAARDHIPFSGAPVSHAEIAAHYDTAADLVGVTPGFIDQTPSTAPDPVIDGDQLMRYAATPDLSMRHREEIAQSERLNVYLNTRVTGLTLTPATDRVAGVNIESNGARQTLTPAHVILCCGGIQTARLLLMVQREHPNFLGGEPGPLGRFYSGHISGAASRIRFSNPEKARRYVVRREADGSFVRGCLTLGPNAQEEHKLLNQYFALNNVPLGDPGFRSGSFSAIHLGLSARHGTSRYMTRYHSGHIETEFEFGLNPLEHLRNIATHPIGPVKGIVEVVRTRAASSHAQPFFSFYNPAGAYALRYHAEQMPDPESRVTLTDRTDRLGMPVPHVDMRVADADISSILRAHDVLHNWMTENGHGQVEWYQPPEQRAAHVRSQASDGYHQMGLTRMSETARTGVVDRDLRVHGVANVFVASPGVLPTGGRAHPTFPTIALGVRLAHMLGAAQATSAKSPEAAKAHS